MQSRRDLTADLVRLRQEYATDVLVSLIEEHELGTLEPASWRPPAFALLVSTPSWLRKGR